MYIPVIFDKKKKKNWFIHFIILIREYYIIENEQKVKSKYEKNMAY